MQGVRVRSLVGELRSHMLHGAAKKRKINSKWMEDLDVRPKSINLLEENIGQKLHNIGFGNDFLDMTPKAQATK